MKDYAIFLCDKSWNIHRVLRLPPGCPQPDKNRITDWLADPSALDECENGQQGARNPLVLRLELKDGQSVPTVLCSFSSCTLVFFVRVENEEDFLYFSEIYTRCVSWAGEVFQDYRDEYYEIQQMNNQLINSQRALVKSNQKLHQVLTEVRTANNLIELLEQDDLTSLYRTTALLRRAQQAMNDHPDAIFDLLAIKLQPLKLVNELFGRKSGDHLLQNFALFLSGLDPTGQGVFAHAGGNTFLIFMPHTPDFASTMEQQSADHLRLYPLPVHLYLQTGVCSAQAGTLSPAEMCDRARLALDSIRGAAQESVAYYNDALHEKLLMQHKILDNIQPAIRRGELKLYLQRKVRLDTGEIIGAEALVRWIHPEMGLVPPNNFIPLLEKEGGIYPVDQCIWEQACSLMHQRRQLGLPDLPVSVNVARSDLYQPDLVEVLLSLLRKYDLPAELLRLEILERAYVDDTARLREVLTQLRSHGFIIEMDDFGVGESSLAMLSGMPVDVIKLDRQFVCSALGDSRQIEVIRFIIQLAKTLQMGIIAEGVETLDQARLLHELGCNHAQGYLYGRPEPAGHFLKLTPDE